MGVSDLAVGGKIRKMVEAFYGRVAAYDSAFDAAEPALAEALARNLYRGAPPSPAAPEAVALYLRRRAEELDGQPIEALLAGSLTLSPVEVAP
jgi:cytochrome b pre-mRNA-processing protein 3